jgi:superfamily I DNA/RNA helicase
MRNPFDNFTFSLARPFLRVTDEQFFEILEGSLERYESHFQTWSSMAPKDHPMKVLFDEADSKPFSSLVGQLSAMVGSEFDTSVAFSIAKACADKGMTLDHYLDWVATYDIQEDVESPVKEGIQLMTIHAAKGLEFPTVIVIGMNEGVLPTRQAINRGDVEEERRLAYVAITRAENRLLLLVRPEESGNERRKFENLVPRFIGELKS